MANNRSSANRNNQDEGLIHNRARQLANNGGINAYLDDEHMIEEIHNSRNGGVRFYEIPLTPERNRPNRQQSSIFDNIDASNRRNVPTQRPNPSEVHAQRCRERNALYPPGNTDVWRDRRTRNQPRPTATPVVTIQVTVDPNTERLRAEREAERQRRYEESTRQMQEYLNEEAERKERAHNERLDEMLNLIRDYSPNHHLLFNRVRNYLEHLRLACEINDPCYSCAFNYLDHGLTKMVELADPTLFKSLKRTYYRGSPSHETSRVIMESGVMNDQSREVSDIIFDFSSLIQMIYSENSKDRLAINTPVFVHVDDHNNLFFNGSHICTLSRVYDFTDGLIYLRQLRRDSVERDVFENEKAILKALHEECWYALLNILRKKYRMFNIIPNVQPKLRRSKSKDNLSADVTLTDGRRLEEYLPTVIHYTRPPFARDGRDITIQRPTLNVTAKLVNDRLILKHPTLHHHVSVPSGYSKRTDHFDYDITVHHDEYVPFVSYRPISLGRYIANNDIDYNLSEDDADYRF